MQEVSGVFQPGIFSFSYGRKSEEKTKTAKIDGKVSFTAGQFARCLALNEPPVIRSQKSNWKSLDNVGNKRVLSKILCATYEGCKGRYM